MTIGQPPGVTGNAGTLQRALVLLGAGFQHRRLQAAGLVQRGLGDAAIAARVGLPVEAVRQVRRQIGLPSLSTW